MGVARAVVFCTFIAFGGFLFGYDIGVISGGLRFEDTQHECSLPSLALDRMSDHARLHTTVRDASQALFSDRIGRRWSIFGWAAIFTVGVTVQTAAETSVGQLLAGRFIAGLGVGALSAIVPLFNGEAAPKHLRGTLLVLYQTMIAAGLFISYVINMGTHHLDGSAAWRIPVGIQIAFGLIICGGILFLPESPRHLLYTGKADKARQAVASLNSCSPEDQLVTEILAELDEGIRIENEGGKATWFECFGKTVRHRTLNGMILMMLQQLNDNAGTGLDSFEIQALLGGVSFIMIFPALYFIEVVGRRKLMLFGASIEAVCALIAGVVGHVLKGPDGATADQLTAQQRAGGQVVVAFGILQVAFFSSAWGPAPRIANDIGSLILLIFFGMLIAAFVYVFFFVPETKGLSLEQVDEMYRSKVKPWHSAKWQPSNGQTRKKAFEADRYPSQRGDAASDITAVTGTGDKAKFAPALEPLSEGEKGNKHETEFRELA
ncbi:hypothetical protein OIO90_005274 [Microbotryomycetes sp. JL221]|nr:hypothetical protein OIO90_005274 [Microbotryomycetes sp. JL221]